MDNSDLQCVLIGQKIGIYADLADILRATGNSFRFNQVDSTNAAIRKSLKRLSGPSIVFISDEVPFSLQLLSDLVWQYASDAIVVILTRKTQTTSLKTPFNNTQFSKLHFLNNRKETGLFLEFLIHSAQLKSEFRRCKSLLGISEKRCQWLVDSSREGIAYISRDLHLYANTTYLNMFHIDSVQELRSISVTDIIVADEHQLFDSFQRNQAKNSDMNHSLILSMKKKNGSVFRANTYVIPSVYKGRKCFQLWVRSMSESNLLVSNNSNKVENVNTPSGSSLATTLENANGNGAEFKAQVANNPFGVVFPNNGITSGTSNNDNPSQNEVKKERIKPATLFKAIIKRKEATLSAQKLTHLKVNERISTLYTPHYILSLKVPIAQKKGTDDYLSKVSGTSTQAVSSIFWDKVKITRLLQLMVRKQQFRAILFIRLSEAAISDRAFMTWLLSGLRRVGRKAAKITFLLPSQVDEKQIKSTIVLVKRLRRFGCKIALDGFIVAPNSNALLKQVLPDYIRLSLPWTRQIQGNEAREIGLSRIIRQLESKHIQVIAPCDFSIDMKRLFTLSGASFCQERSIKNAQ